VAGASGNDDAGMGSGSAYVFERNAGGPGNWGEVKKLTAGDAAGSEFFGAQVSVHGDWVLASADKDADNGLNSGSAYLFYRDEGGEGNWGERRKIVPGDGAANDYFSSAVAIYGETLLVGAYGDDDNGSEAGAAYIFGCSSAPVKIGDGEFSSIGAAYEAAAADATLKARAYPISGSLDCDLEKSVTLEGGYDCNYTEKSGVTSIRGWITIRHGTVSVENIAIE
jgi:hypothetical protein